MHRTSSLNYSVFAVQLDHDSYLFSHEFRALEDQFNAYRTINYIGLIDKTCYYFVKCENDREPRQPKLSHLWNRAGN